MLDERQIQVSKVSELVQEDNLQEYHRDTDKDLNKHFVTKSMSRKGKLNGKALAAVSRELDRTETKARDLENKFGLVPQNAIDDSDSIISDTSKNDTMNKSNTVVSPPRNDTSFNWRDSPSWLWVLIQVCVVLLVIPPACRLGCTTRLVVDGTFC